MNTTIKARNRILSLALAVCLLLGMTLYLPGPVEVSAAPSGSAGDANDGVDFDGLMFYYGTFSHYNGSSYDGAVPILWQVMGEDPDTGKTVALSKYVVDRQTFSYGQNAYAGSNIQNWLDDTFAGSGNFPGAEGHFAEQTQVYTRLYDVNDGSPMNITYGGETYDTNGIAAPVTQQFYLPWGTLGLNTGTGTLQPWADGKSDNVGWDSEADKNSNNVLDVLTASYKDGSNTFYWLRSPDSSDPGIALCVFTVGNVNHGLVNSPLGVRPAFQLNPSSVIFTSEILDDATDKPWATQADGTDYVAAAGGDAPNFKLVIVDGGLSAGTVEAYGQNISSNPTITAAPGAPVAVTANGATANTRLTYKIVSRTSGEIVGYGQDAGNTNLTVDAADLDGTDLIPGTYTVYVWAQLNNPTYSHEGSDPQHFTLNVESPDTTKPEVAGVFPSGTSVSLGTSGLSVTFNEDMDTNMPTTGTVSIDKDATLENEEWENDRTIIYELDDLKPSTQYTVTISGFKDVAGNVMDSHTHKFTTVDAPQPGQHTVTVQPDPAGAGFPSASHATAAEDDIVTLTAKPNEGWEFTRWSSDSSGVVFDDDEGSTATFDMPDEDVVITAHYTEIDDGNGDNGNGDNGNGDNGNGDNNGNGGGGSNSSGNRNSSRSSGGSSTPDSRVAKTQLPASAFSWDGDRTLTIDHERITPLGLLSVRWDDVTLTRGTDFGVYSGSVIVRFDAAFIAAQAPGAHTLRVEFLNHTGETTVTVGQTAATEESAGHPDNDTHNPNTGGYPDGSYPGATDNPNTRDNGGIWPALLLGSLGAAALALYRGERKPH